MAGLWQHLVPVRKQNQFFTKSLIEWLYENLVGESRTEEYSWSTLFGIAVWWVWKWRCGNIFGVNGKCRDRVKFTKDLAKEVMEAKSSLGGSNVATMRVERMVAWAALQNGWLKMKLMGHRMKIRGGPWPVGFCEMRQVIGKENLL
ncbi:putative ribonuclease H protein [Cardamine amara subsp. amara]|uniref:Ribonuclease H protein n=1 Tax=Cardamine amara subsp. amara TaxID=228776 RepID=A0ABD0ZE75_CARAN